LSPCKRPLGGSTFVPPSARRQSTNSATATGLTVRQTRRTMRPIFGITAMRTAIWARPHVSWFLGSRSATRKVPTGVQWRGGFTTTCLTARYISSRNWQLSTFAGMSGPSGELTAMFRQKGVLRDLACQGMRVIIPSGTWIFRRPCSRASVTVDREKRPKNQPPVIDMKRTTCGASICCVKSWPKGLIPMLAMIAWRSGASSPGNSRRMGSRCSASFWPRHG